MKRIHLFEFEDLPWFPQRLRQCMTRYLATLHRLLGTQAHLVELLEPLLRAQPSPRVVDLGSGDGGPLPAAASLLRRERGLDTLRVTLTDRFPNQAAAARINAGESGFLEYRTTPVDATDVDAALPGVRTMICSLHHVRPDAARRILEDAQRARQPFCSYELSDNSFPRALFWLVLPFNVISVLLLTPLVRPLTWEQVFFTYVLPILPLAIAWDGAVSNARTYGPADLTALTAGLGSAEYRWEIGTLPGKGGKRVYLRGVPAEPAGA